MTLTTGYTTVDGLSLNSLNAERLNPHAIGFPSDDFTVIEDNSQLQSNPARAEIDERRRKPLSAVADELVKQMQDSSANWELSRILPPRPSADQDPSELQLTKAWRKLQEYSQLNILLLTAEAAATATAEVGGLGVIVAMLALLRVVVNKVGQHIGEDAICAFNTAPWRRASSHSPIVINNIVLVNQLTSPVIIKEYRCASLNSVNLLCSTSKFEVCVVILQELHHIQVLGNLCSYPSLVLHSLGCISTRL
ncbi:hypothetical protein ARMGADRAFT_1164752 [Armillaria gallica]|uniref:Uncharacterized protein n=1 Tax=Armillaria gallica TaxID=47427 RepID=A0A2H3E038_ARMGA|nr:hypothetical protein ARMGADRAFT_1164752 [Armillaria gallica]